MSRRPLTVLAAALVSTLTAPPLQAAYDAFLKIEGVPGESTDAKHKDWIEVESFNLGSLQGGTTATEKARTSHPQIRLLTLTKRVDKATPKLHEAASKGTNFPSATLEVRKAGGQEYLEYKLTNVMISSVRLSGQGGAQPTESLSLNFAKIELEYKEQKEQGAGSARSQLSSAAQARSIALTPQITKLTATPTSGFVPLAVNFAAEGIGTCQNGVVIDWGDGSIPEVQFSIVGGKGVFPSGQSSHTYSRAGVFAARAWGINDPNRPKKDPRQPEWPNGCAGYQSVNVTVRELIKPASALSK